MQLSNAREQITYQDLSIAMADPDPYCWLQFPLDNQSCVANMNILDQALGEPDRVLDSIY